MGAEDCARAPAGNFIYFFDENSARLPKFLHYMLVVGRFSLRNVNRGAIEIESNFDDVNGPHDTGAKPTRF